jgi:PPM family protein phosphatase
VNLIKRLIQAGSKKSGSGKTGANVNTAPLTDQQIQTVTSKGVKYEPSQITYGCGQSVGQQRDHNEDSLVAMTYTIASEGQGIPFGLFIIADGMGGHQFGEVASATAVRTMAGSILKKFHPVITSSARALEGSLQEIMHAAIDDAQRAVMQAAPGSGTTLTAVLILGQHMTIGHVGDSRVYSIRPDGRNEVLTRDHSLVKRLEELGQISSEEAAAHPQRNVLYRALGQGEILEPDIFNSPFPQPGYLLLCSDGLWGVVTAEEFAQTIKDAPSLQDACQRLLHAANSAGGPDNISVIIVQLFG